MNDAKELRTVKHVAERSKSSGLHLTLDGVHINSKGAQIIADGITRVLAK